MEPFKTTCPECGKEVITYDPHKKNFCNNVCETNYKYKKKYQQDQKNI